jgi:hypothetical protein
LLRDYVSVTSMTRVGARVASAAPDAGPATCETGTEAPPCAPGTVPALAQAAADAIQRSGSAMPSHSINYILVYKANDKGCPGAAGSTVMPASSAGVTSCVRFTWRASADKFRYADGTWTSKDINACVNESDTLGIYLSATHRWIAGLWGGSVQVGDRAVMKFEPLPDDACKSGRPAAHP